MHEISICESILNILKEQARLENFETVRRVSVEIGPLSGVDIEALKFGFDVIMKDSLAEGALLDIVETQAQATCLDCGATATISQRHDPCPQCGSHDLKITSGKEMRIKELEVN